jgi:hypothetical protein
MMYLAIYNSREMTAQDGAERQGNLKGLLKGYQGYRHEGKTRLRE